MAETKYPTKSTAKKPGWIFYTIYIDKITVIAPNLELDPRAKAPAKLNKLNIVNQLKY